MTEPGTKPGTNWNRKDKYLCPTGLCKPPTGLMLTRAASLPALAASCRQGLARPRGIGTGPSPGWAEARPTFGLAVPGPQSKA